MATLAHELRQPLSNIESIAYHLSLVLPQSDEAVQGSLTRIRQLVEQSNGILTDGLRQAAAGPPRQEPPQT
jgi:phosphoglycerate-specific signal transduction histidine kinase